MPSSPKQVEFDYDVVIVGYGPVGAMVANLLGRYGVRTLVVERASAIYPHPRAIHVDDEVMRIFQSLGVHEEIRAQSRPVEGMQFVDGAGRTLLTVSKSAEAQPRFGFPAANLFRQPSLEAILRRGVERYPVVDIWLGCEAEAVRQDAQSVLLTVRGVEGESHTVRGAYLLGCDGARSTVRRLARIALRSLGRDESWLVVDARLKRPVDLPTNHVQQICDPRRPTTFVPSHGDHRRWEFMLLPGETAQQMERSEVVRTLLRRFVDPAALAIERATVYTFHSLLAEQWRRGRIFLLGDAAHQMPPFLGQGMCAGIRDAHNLAWKLWMVLQGLAAPRLLATYERERTPHVASVIRLVRWAGLVIQTRNRALAALRDGLLRLLWMIPRVRRRLRSVESVVPPLRTGCLAQRNVLAGKLAPQPRVESAPGEGYLLDDLLDPGFALLVIGGGRRAAAVALSVPVQVVSVLDAQQRLPTGDALVVRDETNLLVDWCARHKVDLLLLRPDRVVFGGYRWDQLGQMEADLCRWFSGAGSG